MEILCNSPRGGGKTKWMIDRVVRDILDGGKPVIAVFQQSEAKRLKNLAVERLVQLGIGLEDAQKRTRGLCRAPADVQRHGMHPSVCTKRAYTKLYVDSLEQVLGSFFGMVPDTVTTDAYSFPLAFKASPLPETD